MLNNPTLLDLLRAIPFSTHVGEIAQEHFVKFYFFSGVFLNKEFPGKSLRKKLWCISRVLLVDNRVFSVNDTII